VSPWKVILATMVIFVCGVVTGALVIKTQGWHPPSPYNSGFAVPGPASVQMLMRQMAQAHMSLTTNQHEKIEKILQDSQATNAAIRVRIAPQLQAEKERAQKAINQLLTSEQQGIFAELLKKPEQWPGGRGEGRGRRGGEGGGFRPQNTNRFPTNGLPEDGRGRPGRRGFNPSTNGLGNATRISTNTLPQEANAKMDGSSPTNNPSTNAP